MYSPQKLTTRTLEVIDQVLTGNIPRSSQVKDVQNATSISLRTGALFVLVAGIGYGSAMGCYAAIANQRPWMEQGLQMLFSGLKVPLLISATLLIALPSFFILNTLFGLRQQFKESLRAIVLAQTGLVIILFSLAPITLFVYVSVSPMRQGYSLAVLWNAIAFGGSSVLAQLLLRRNYRHLILQDARHRKMVWVWIFVYAFVGIQVAYILRPFIGSPASEISFFREDPFENAYVRVFQLIGSATDLWH